jgi:hypothetical protein
MQVMTNWLRWPVFEMLLEGGGRVKRGELGGSVLAVSPVRVLWGIFGVDNPALGPIQIVRGGATNGFSRPGPTHTGTAARRRPSYRPAGRKGGGRRGRDRVVRTHVPHLPNKQNRGEQKKKKRGGKREGNQISDGN